MSQRRAINKDLDIELYAFCVCDLYERLWLQESSSECAEHVVTAEPWNAQNGQPVNGVLSRYWQ